MTVQFCRQLRSTIVFLLLSLSACFGVVVEAPTAWGQFSGLPDVSTDAASQLPEDVDRSGQIEITWVESPLDNRPLFQIASPTIYDRSLASENRLSVERRAQEVEERLEREAGRLVESKQPRTVAVATLNDRPIIQVQNPGRSRPLRLVTVTEPDADFHGESPEKLAQEWRDILEGEIERMTRLLSPEVIQQRVGQAFQILLGLGVASGIIGFLRHLLVRRQQFLKDRYQAQPQGAEAGATSDSTGHPAGSQAEAKPTGATPFIPSSFTATLQRQFSLKGKLEIYAFLKWLLFWSLIVIWYVGIVAIIFRVPLLMKYGGWVLSTPLQLVLIWFFVSLAIRVGKNLIRRLTRVWQDTSLLPLGEGQRRALRAATLAGALEGLVTSVLLAVGVIWTLNLFNVPTSSILVGGAAIGLAVSFGSQSLVKDLVNGCLILAEDQFAVGDVIAVGSEGGLVENLNLRVTQLRNSEGELITIPNSTIGQVKNLTRLWSRVDFTIEVAYENDPRQVLSLLEEVAQQMYGEPEWHQSLPEPPSVLGIDHLSYTGMLVRVWIKTVPAQQWSVGREFRLRVRQAFEKHGIQIGKPQWIAIRESSSPG